MKLFCEMTDQELDEINLEKFTKFKVGDIVTHVNEGKTYCPKVGTIGTVVGHSNHGLHHWGGFCVTVDVLWSGQAEPESLIYSLARKVD